MEEQTNESSDDYEYEEENNSEGYRLCDDGFPDLSEHLL